MKRFATNLWSSLAVGGVLLSSVALQAEGPQSGVSTRPTAPQPPQETYLQGEDGRLMILAEGTAEAVPTVPAPEASSTSPSPRAADCPTCRDGSEGTVYYGEPCGEGCRKGRGCKLIHQMFDWLNPHGACVHSPDYGFRPPVKQPVYRRPVAYTQWYPQNTNGQQVAYQQMGQVQQSAYQPRSVYWPTDTTQLGYYYQQVPHWHPYGGMIPGPPQPQQWHQYAAPACQNGHCRVQILGTAETIAPYGSPQGTYYQQSPVQTLPEPTQVPTELVPPQAAPTTPTEAALQPTINPGLLPLGR